MPFIKPVEKFEKRRDEMKALNYFVAYCHGYIEAIEFKDGETEVLPEVSFQASALTTVTRWKA